MIIYGFRGIFPFLKNGKMIPMDIDRLQKSDYDILCSIDEFNSLINSIPKEDFTEIRPIPENRYFIKTIKGNYDIHIITQNNTSNTHLYNNFESMYKSGITVEDKYGNIFRVPLLQTLIEFKKSHRFIRKNFEKTMNDYYRFSTFKKIDKEDESEFYKLRLIETLKRAEKYTKHINLNQKKEDFFDTKGVTYVYDHDSIHESVKLTNEPIYKKMLMNGHDVLCSKEQWDNLAKADKIKAVLEEAYVISIERYLTKSKRKNPYESFCTALEKICTTLTKGWFREFAYENYMEIKMNYSEDFWDKFQKDLKKGLIKSHRN